MPRAKTPASQSSAQAVVTDIMSNSPHGALAQMFVLDAIIKHAERIAASERPKSYNAEFSIIPWDTWKQVAQDVKDRCDKALQ